MHYEDNVSQTGGADSRSSARVKAKRFAAPALVLVVGALLLLALQHVSKTFDYHSVVHSVMRLPPTAWAAAFAATALSYLALVARDAVGLRHIETRVPATALWIGATVGSALGNATGFGALTGGAVRCRVYGTAGVTPAQVGRLTLFTSVTLAVSLALMTAAGMVVAAPTLSPMFHLPPPSVEAIGASVLAAFAALVAFGCRAKSRAVTLRWVTIDIPGRAVLTAQVFFSIVDVVAAALALWAVLPHAGVPFVHFLVVFSAAMLLGMIGHTPGGIGIFEAAMVFSLGHAMPVPQMVAALLAYRAIYFGAPLILSAGLLAGFEGRLLSARFDAARREQVLQLVPLFLGIFAFVVGGMLVISGATPAFRYRLMFLQTVVPLWVLESSQLLASMFGVALLFVARGLMRRLDAAWWITMAVAVANLVLSLVKGLAFFEVGVLGILILLLIVTRKRFDRASSLFGEPLTAMWLVSVAIVLALAFWVLFFAFRDIPYRDDLWWQFAFDGRAPRALRATLAAALVGLAFAFQQLLRPPAGRFVAPHHDDLRDAQRIIRAQSRSDAGLAMMGDKSFLFSESREAFLMYAKHGRTWAALHDPVGPSDEWPALIAKFVALAHTHGGRAAFYQVRADGLPLYLDAGLSLMKLGEEAHIGLDDFELVGPHRSHLRYALKRGERDGFSVEIVEPQAIAGLLPTLKQISDAWLTSRTAREKSFSVAAFTAEYLSAQSVMLVRRHGVPMAFVTYMTTDLKTDATVGVMRHLPDTSPYAMEYLFTKLALHLKASGFSNLSLGIAPLSGMHATPLASSWHRLASLVWRFGGRFYNFRGLRGFKSKFQPRWEPRYLAASGSVGVFFTLADLSLLAGGWRS
ncbi:bifunctional lysylphosphatidylglycerol flippase/synthetase MprF [Pararobbsia silviterrae]|uniref:Phosphatidylglycerol lysyltransferase n=1 Tax=Pararobbsia silviterrae TaxID=1792498 RepID=A0A494XS03_9BURK|nr:bifunctional lysylphosphatidylglycerol flippase/synthetase MprF [Pararobbsia silviterrae]RKP53385.1 bifunctional lysylphosphatidylglycerol flippase/synthetase MprF [Pararobbsia silviterrae]